MKKRLTRITTGTGDDGTTGLADGTRVGKDSLRTEALGSVDELNSLLGVLLAQAGTARFQADLTTLQHWLFDLGGELALPGTQVLTATHGEQTRALIDRLNAELPPLEEFVLPGGGMAAAFCHQARSVCRRTERELLRLSRAEALNPHSLVLLNRLSDLLFVMARHLARADGAAEPVWRPGRELS